MKAFVRVVLSLLLLLLLLPLLPQLAAGRAEAAELVCDGVLGNSGEQGATLVKFAPQEARGLGVACDRFGSLWDRGGAGVLNRYAVDGRLLAQHPLPGASGSKDQLTLVGDTLVLLLNGQLYTLPVTAQPGTSPTKTAIRCDGISFGASAGRIVAFDAAEVFVVDPLEGTRRALLPAAGVEQVELGPDKAVYVQTKGRVRKYVGGNEVAEGWPKRGPGERMQLCDGFWFGNAWHGTIRRYDSELSPAPGVVLGGASGSFIGHLDQNSELSNGRGLAKVRQGLLAVSGIGGVLHLLACPSDASQFEIVRRIGCVPQARGLGLDRAGNVWWHSGSWRWDDRPDAPLRFGVNAPESPGIAQAVMLENDGMVAPGFMWGKPAMYRGPLTGEVTVQRIDGPCDLPRGAVASAVYRSGAKFVLLSIDAAGRGAALRIGSDGAFQGNEGPVELKTAPAAKPWTSLAMKGDDVLLAAADGNVVELVRDGSDWKEQRRTGGYGRGDDEKFGAEIFLACDSGRLWIADTRRHRVVVLDLASGGLVATFGAIDRAGSDLGSLAEPRTIAARGDRAVVFDSGNQRLMKLRLMTDTRPARRAASGNL